MHRIKGLGSLKMKCPSCGRQISLHFAKVQFKVKGGYMCKIWCNKCQKFKVFRLTDRRKNGGIEEV